MTTVLTREYLDARPDGWLDYAAKRIAQLYDFLDTYTGLSFLIFRFGFKQICCNNCLSELRKLVNFVRCGLQGSW